MPPSEDERLRPSQKLERLLAETRAEFPRFRIIEKQTSKLHRAIARFLLVVSVGQMRHYLDGFHTTIGQRMYVAGDWESMSSESRYLLLRHERVHMRQFRRFTPVGMAILYVLLPLPLGLAYFRARFEKEAYAESIRGSYELYGMSRVTDPRYRAHLLENFTGPGYGWMWPFRRHLDRWYDGVVATLETERNAGSDAP